MRLGTMDLKYDLIARSKDGSHEQVIGEINVPVELVVNELEPITSHQVVIRNGHGKTIREDTEINLINSGQAPL